MMSRRTYTLRELADSVDLRPRTVRSYIEKGLLRGPEVMGPGAVYSEDHLLRLRLIRTLRDLGVSLDEIRRRLQPLGTEEIRSLLAGEAEFPSPAERRRPRPRRRKPPREVRYGNLERLLRTLRDLSGGTAVARGPAGEFWHRILVTPDVEFMVREGFSPEALAQMRKLADHLRFYLMGGTRRD